MPFLDKLHNIDISRAFELTGKSASSTQETITEKNGKNQKQKPLSKKSGPTSIVRQHIMHMSKRHKFKSKILKYFLAKNSQETVAVS